MSDIVREWYEDAENIDEMLDWNKRKLKKWEEKVVSLLPEGAQILDVGCGMGREAFALTDMGFSVVGIDISEAAVEQVSKLALQKGYHIPFFHYDGHHLPFQDEAFDVVIIWAQTFGLLYGDSYKSSFLKECKRVLKENGLISFSGHDYEYLKDHYRAQLVERRFYPYPGAEIYWEAFLPQELSKHAEEAGFSVVLCERGEIYKREDGVVLHCLARK
ncbi:MAG: class I SAM-dependent methyltransferase [Bacillota bacterium]|jgi:ubiquinone/menaquinone biosynthesis C-methylase UbiE|nr:class I SAM-dependent methyltransferase [Bacillota bacterium]NLU55524.1 class I SAM-dependent methyltransferase [Bacillota bacterium]HOA90202.1 class I SAM-dependent methyltransferase [Bacillota bacterium]HPQ10409.1 class I SAM-dependent methyltransferase [Bacillota bacterium]HPZ73976.1 class I SAM-dependent methyltransferase [Bacillota bacterium]